MDDDWIVFFLLFLVVVFWLLFSVLAELCARFGVLLVFSVCLIVCLVAFLLVFCSRAGELQVDQSGIELVPLFEPEPEP